MGQAKIKRAKREKTVVGVGEIAEAVARFRENFENRSYGGRNPELGKMIKCQVCLRRHRSSIVCKQRFVEEK